MTKSDLENPAGPVNIGNCAVHKTTIDCGIADEVVCATSSAVIVPMRRAAGVETLDYIAEMARGLAGMARGLGCRDLAVFLQLVEDEAHRVIASGPAHLQMSQTRLNEPSSAA